MQQHLDGNCRQFALQNIRRGIWEYKGHKIEQRMIDHFNTKRNLGSIQMVGLSSNVMNVSDNGARSAGGLKLETRHSGQSIVVHSKSSEAPFIYL